MKSDYALRAALELASAYGRGPGQTAEIAARRSIPESYLEQILTVLRRAGLVSSVRGPQGGHTLAMHPSRITARDVVEALDGPLLVVEDGSGGVSERHAPDSEVQQLWSEVRTAMEAVLERVTIEDLAARQMARGGHAMYHI